MSTPATVTTATALHPLLPAYVAHTHHMASCVCVCVLCVAKLAPPDIPVVVVATKVDLVQAPAVSYAQAKVHSEFALARRPPLPNILGPMLTIRV